LPKVTIFHCFFFPSKLISKCCNFSMNWDRVKGFSASVTSYTKIDLRLFLACHMSKIFLAKRGNPPPFKPPNRRGHIPLLATPWCNIWIGDGAEKVVTFLTTFLKRKTVFWA
jgi:hypothetical protein